MRLSVAAAENSGAGAGKDGGGLSPLLRCLQPWPRRWASEISSVWGQLWPWRARRCLLVLDYRLFRDRDHLRGGAAFA